MLAPRLSRARSVAFLQKRFSPLAKVIHAHELKAWLADGGEIALIDVREAGQHGDGHPLFAVPAPYSRFELVIGALVPNRQVRMVLIDEGDGVAVKAAARAEALGFAAVHVLGGGAPAWGEAGYTLFAGVNVPSKTFGELVEAVRGTPHITADALAEMAKRQTNHVIVDGRTFAEFQRFSIPGAISCPNGELALRIGTLAPDPATTIVVNCAGRTRSIIGAQTLIDFGVANPVVALENGTQGWVLSGRALDHGAGRRYGQETAGDPDAARGRALAHAKRRGVRLVEPGEVARWLADPSRTSYLFDIRSAEEYSASGHPAFVHAPGGQLVQATDQWVGVRHARVVVADDECVRAPMIAAWLRGLGLDAHALAGGIGAASGLDAARDVAEVSFKPPPPIEAEEVAGLVASGEALAIDLRPSPDFRAGHIAGARWATRARLCDALSGDAKSGAARLVVMVAERPEIAGLAALDLAALDLPRGAEVRFVGGGPQDWARAGIETVASPDDPTPQAAIDFSSFTHGRHQGDLDASRQYLAWELGLIGQLDADERAAFHPD